MNKNIPTAKQASLKKILWAIFAIVIILLVVSSMFIKTNLVNNQEHIATPSDTLPVNQVFISASPSPYPKDFPQLSVSIDQIATFQDRYFMHGTLNLNDATNGSVDNVDVSEMILTDSTGKQIPIEPLDFRLDPSAGMEFSFYTQGKGAQGTLTLTITSADFHFEQNQISSPGFEVDFGDNPQENQEWSLNKDFELVGRHIHLSSVKALKTDGISLLEFTITGDPDVRGAFVFDTSVQSFSGDDFYTFFQNGKIITRFKYANAFPAGKHQFAFNLISFSALGNWQTTFDPTSIDKSPSTANSELYNACLLNENWVSRETLSTEIPAELSGMLVMDNAFTGSDPLFTAMIDLKGGEKQNTPPWLPIAFSPDGTMMINYDWQTHSAHITNLYSGEAKDYAWSKGPSNRISWLNNTDLIAYDSDDGIYISHVDGSGLYKVNGTDSETFLSGWLPDGQHLLISRKSYKKPMLLQISDVNSGEAKDLFSFSSSYITAAMPSPSGEKVLFEDGVTGIQQTGIFIANLDGSERHLIASFWRMLIGSYTWSPDGKWVIVSATDVKHGNEMTSFLINPDSCKTIRLSNMDWAVRAWGAAP